MIQTLKKITLPVLLVLCNVTYSQSLYPSQIKIETDTNRITVNAKSGAGIVQLNEGSSELAFKLDISTIDTDNQEIDSLLSSLENQTIYFKGNFPITNINFNNRSGESQHDYIGKILLTINGITKETFYTCNILNFNNGDDEFAVGTTVYPLRINLYFSFEPRDFKIDKLYPKLQHSVKIEVANGLINKLNLNSETIFRN